jgi:hypothetical protein
MNVLKFYKARRDGSIEILLVRTAPPRGFSYHARRNLPTKSQARIGAAQLGFRMPRPERARDIRGRIVKHTLVHALGERTGFATSKADA